MPFEIGDWTLALSNPVGAVPIAAGLLRMTGTLCDGYVQTSCCGASAATLGAASPPASCGAPLIGKSGWPVIGGVRPGWLPPVQSKLEVSASHASLRLA